MQPMTDLPSMPLVEVLVRDALDAKAVPRVRRLLDDAVALRPAHLVVDLSGCDVLDAAGIGLLVEVHRRVWTAGGRLTLRGLSPRLRRMIELARADRVLHTAASPAGRQPSRHPIHETLVQKSLTDDDSRSAPVGTPADGPTGGTHG